LRQRGGHEVRRTSSEGPLVLDGQTAEQARRDLHVVVVLAPAPTHHADLQIGHRDMALQQRTRTRGGRELIAVDRHAARSSRSATALLNVTLSSLWIARSRRRTM